MLSSATTWFVRFFCPVGSDLRLYRQLGPGWRIRISCQHNKLVAPLEKTVRLLFCAAPHSKGANRAQLAEGAYPLHCSEAPCEYVANEGFGSSPPSTRSKGGQFGPRGSLDCVLGCKPFPRHRSAGDGFESQ